MILTNEGQNKSFHPKHEAMLESTTDSCQLARIFMLRLSDASGWMGHHSVQVYKVVLFCSKREQHRLFFYYSLHPKM
jgi:hypothetical protein